MGGRAKVVERARARELRAAGATLQTIAATLGVSRSSVSTWVRDVELTASPRRKPASRRPHPAHLAKVEQIVALDAEGVRRIGVLGVDAFLVAGVALYAGEGAKTDGVVKFANTDSAMVRLFCAWLRRFFEIDEARLKVSVYLHDGLDLDAAERHWSHVTGVPRSQFRAPYRATADPSIRVTKHEFGCVYVNYSSAETHRRIMGLVRALLSSDAIPG